VTAPPPGRCSPVSAPDQQRLGAAVEIAGACAWPGPRLHSADEVSDPDGWVELARAEAPLWLQLRLAADESNVDVQRWLEGSLNAWADDPGAALTWQVKADVLHDLVAARPGPLEPALEATPLDRLLGLLPQLYGRGIFRTVKDAFGQGTPPNGVCLFPTVGFQVAQDKDPEQDAAKALAPAPVFWALRMSVAVIGNTVLSVRLPDLLCAGREVREDDLRESDYQPAPHLLAIPERFFPSSPDAAQVAEGIAHHQAATARSASEQLRERLHEVETPPPMAATGGEDGTGQITRHRARQLELESRDLVLDMSATVDALDRQISRVLRRFGSFGLGSGAIVGTSNPGSPEPSTRSLAKLVPDETSLRYRFALDEIRSLRDDCKRAVEAIIARIANYEQDDRNRFELAGALLASLILAPTLVAGLFGANVAFPGSNQGRGTWALGLAIIAFMALGLLGISFAWTRDWRRFSEWFNHVRLRWIAALVGLAAVAVAVAEAIIGFLPE
jgi:hypothetical protein